MAKIVCLASSNLLFGKDIFSGFTLSHSKISRRVLSEINKLAKTWIQNQMNNNNKNYPGSVKDEMQRSGPCESTTHSREKTLGNH